MSDVVSSIRRRDLLTMASIAAIAVIGMLVAAPGASGQAVIDQYVPQGNPTGGPGGASGSLGSLGTPAGETRQAVTTDSGPGSSKGGNLPFTGYPVTSFVWIVLAVLLAGALVRVAAPMLGRRGARGTA
jgi:hypothetical protein